MDDEWTLPDDLAVVERQVVRVVVQDARRDVLLFRTREFTAPDLGEWWELPGGGIDPGETYATAAVRELREETGLVVRLAVTAPPVDTSAQFDYEAEDYLGHRWWPVADLVASGERFYPGRLPELVPDVLAGTEIDEPFELFS